MTLGYPGDGSFYFLLLQGIFYVPFSPGRGCCYRHYPGIRTAWRDALRSI